MLYNVQLTNTGSGQIVYSENLPFKKEPTVEDIKSFIKLIRPYLEYDSVSYTYLGPYKGWS